MPTVVSTALWLGAAILLKLLHFFISACTVYRKSKKDLQIKYQVVQHGQQQAGGQPRQKVLVTGGCGLLGRHIVELLIEKFRGEFEIVVLDAAASTCKQRRKEVTYVAGDVRVPTHVQAALSGVAAVIHSAGLLQGASTDIELMKAIEIDGTRNLLEACLDKDIKAFIYTSSVFVHWTKAGSDSSRAGTEDEPLPPETHIQMEHGAFKRAAERLVLAANGHVIRTVALRPGLLLSKDLSKDALVWTVGGLLSQPLRSPDKHIPCCWVADAARAHVCALIKLLRPNDEAAIIKASELLMPQGYDTDKDMITDDSSKQPALEGSKEEAIAGKAYHVCYSLEEEQPTQRQLFNLVVTSSSHRTQLLYKVATMLPSWAVQALVHFNEGSARRLGFAPMHEGWTDLSLKAGCTKSLTNIRARGLLQWHPTAWPQVAQLIATSSSHNISKKDE